MKAWCRDENGHCGCRCERCGLRGPGEITYALRAKGPQSPPQTPASAATPVGPKRDLRGFWPGMTAGEAAEAITYNSLRCQEKSDYTACASVDGEIDLTYARELRPSVIQQVDLYMESGLDANAMVARISEQYGVGPRKTTPGHKDDSNVPLLSAIGLRLLVSTWDLLEGLILQLSGAQSYRLQLYSPFIAQQNDIALRARLDAERARLNPAPKF